MKSSVRIALTYSAIAVLWIVLSDRLVLLFAQNPEWMTTISIVKGILYVLVTALLLYLMINREMKLKQSMIEELGQSLTVKNELISELHHRVKNNLQFMNSIIHIETDKNGFTEKAFEHIESRIIALSALHNLVYLDREMESLSLRRVLEGYFDLFSEWRPRVELAVDEAVSFSLEHTTSLILLFNELLQVIGEQSGAEGLHILLSNIAGERFLCRISSSDPANLDAVAHALEAGADFSIFLDALRGSVDHCREGTSLLITFTIPGGPAPSRQFFPVRQSGPS